MNWLEMRKLSAELLDQARELQNQLTDDTSAEDFEARAAEVEDLLKRSRDLTARADRLEALETSAGEVQEAQERACEPLSQIDDPEATIAETGERLLPAQLRDTDAEARGHFESFGHFAEAVYRSSPMAGANFAQDARLAPLAAASGLSQGVGSEGGFTVPPQFRAEIVRLMQQDVTNLVSRTRQFPIQGFESVTLPATNETSRTTGSRHGGVQGYWISEAEQLTASKPKLRQMKLEPHQLAAFVYVTEKLLMNGPALESWLSQACSEELVWLQSDAILNGDGAGKPLGIMNSGALITVAKEASQPADTFNQENIAKMWSRMNARDRQNSVWLINQDVDPQLNLMVTTVKNVAGAENVGGFQATLYNRDRDTLMGRPILRTEYNKTLGDKGDVLLVNLGAYATAYHQAGVSAAQSMHLRFDYAEMAFRFMADLDGQPMLTTPLTPANGSSTLSPFVALADRA